MAEMVLKEGKQYRVTDTHHKGECNRCEDCHLIVLMEKGFIPDNVFTVRNKLGGNLIVEFSSGDKFAVREQHLMVCDFLEEI